MSLTIKLAEEELILLPERGLFWARESMLLVADWHVGKAAAFRTAGIGVPDGDLDEEFARLESMATVTGADSLVILGDFVHAREGLTPDLAREVGSRFARTGLRVSLISGNHDRSAGIERLTQFGLEMLGDSLDCPPFLLRHAPEDHAGAYGLAGHVHPAVWIGEGKRGGGACALFLVRPALRSATCVWRLYRRTLHRPPRR